MSVVWITKNQKIFGSAYLRKTYERKNYLLT